MQLSHNTVCHQPAQVIAQALSSNILSAQPTAAKARNLPDSHGASHNCRRSPPLVRTLRTKPPPADTSRYHAYRVITTTYGDVRNDRCRKTLHRGADGPRTRCCRSQSEKGKRAGQDHPAWLRSVWLRSVATCDSHRDSEFLSPKLSSHGALAFATLHSFASSAPVLAPSGFPSLCAFGGRPVFWGRSGLSSRASHSSMKASSPSGRPDRKPSRSLSNSP